MSGEREIPAEDSIKVVCRFRPLNDSEEKAGSKFVVKFPSGPEENCISIAVSDRLLLFADIPVARGQLLRFDIHNTSFLFPDLLHCTPFFNSNYTPINACKIVFLLLVVACVIRRHTSIVIQSLGNKTKEHLF